MNFANFKAYRVRKEFQLLHAFNGKNSSYKEQSHNCL